MSGVGLDADLIAYYDAEALGGHRVEHGSLRHDLRRGFAELLRAENRRSVIDVGAGPGLDTALWSGERAALDAVGSVELFETFSPNGDDAWQYQYAVVRTTA